MRTAKRITILVVGLSLLYVISFVVLFDLLGPPTRTPQHGWIGPAKRFDPQVIDIGGVYEYQGGLTPEYLIFWPMCKTWTYLNGLD